MKKIYSIVLMATALLIGTNAWAGTTRPVANATDFENAWKAAQDGDVIQLSADVSIAKTFWLGTETMNGTAKSITLDLNGHKLTNDGTRQKLFFISHGELKVITSVAGGQIIHDGQSNSSSYEIFRITGSTYKNIDPKTAESYYSHLVIGEGVTLTAKANAVVVDQMNWTTDPAYSSVVASGVTNTGNTWPDNLRTNVYKHAGSDNNYGLANGARVDIYGTIRAHKYAIKANGNLGAPSMERGSKNTFSSDPDQQVNYAIDENDVIYTPFIHLHSTADLRTLDVDKTYSIAAYSGGYARWLVEGTCIGSTGVYVKSGELNLNNAVVASNYTGEYQPADPDRRGSGVDAGGSGIVMESKDAYAGDIDVTIEGDTKVTGTKGYAIDEFVSTKNDSTKVDAITIKGGTFEAGTQGTMSVTETTIEASKDATQETVITIIGGNADNATTKLGDQTLEQFLSGQSEGTYVTKIDNGKGGQTLVINQGDAPSPVAEWTDIAALPEGTDANWTGLTAGVIGDGTTATTVTLGELQINAGSAGNFQELTIKKNATLEVKNVVMNAYARITVEPGAKFIVTGTQGIVAPVAENIVLQASATDQAVFLFNPAVTSNRHPNATVQMYAKAHHAADGTWYAQHFGIPTYNTPDITWAPGGTYLHRWGESGWEDISALSQLEPFRGYRINNTSETAAGVYTFKGELNGNTDAPLKFVKPYYNLVANSYAAPMDLKAVFTDIQSQYGNAVELTAWIYISDDDRHASITQASVASNEDPEAIPTIAPMQGFILYCGASQPANGSIRYKESVWDNPNKTGVPIMAPARKGNDNSIRATIVVSTEKSKDEVVLRESDEYSSAFDNGADAHKYMSERVFDLYSENNGENYSNVATDNLAGTKLTLQAKNETAYTMSFRNVNNFNYALRDNLSGAVIPVEEGATYDFSMAEGTTANERFEIIEISEIMTAIDNVEAARSAKGIYTILGQYVGESSILNTLPSGIYVVDGQRIVK